MKGMKLCFSSLIWRYLSACDRSNSVLRIFFFFVCSTNISTRACACVRVMWKRCVECEENPTLWESEETFRVMMVNVCASGPGQQHFPAGGSRSSCWMLFIWSTEQLQSSDFKVELDRCWKPFHQPSAHKNRKDSCSEERLSDWEE